MMIERELAREAVPSASRTGTASLVKPDGYFHLRIDRSEEDEQGYVCLEIDNGSKFKEARFQKLRRLLAPC